MPKRSLPLIQNEAVPGRRELSLMLGAPAALRASEVTDGDEHPALMQVGELAKATGKTVRAIHLYEELGLLRPANRSKGRYRLFSADAELRVR
ncbi:MAG TPA: MerR family DNA-binding transcriptional regulator, partial [Polyangiaceae bacterium]|nr:MerR family DNA-binding transcriptional regulator [Polyangiaceae bacterium]